MERLTNSQTTAVFDSTSNALEEIEKAVAVINDVINEYCCDAHKQDLFAQHSMLAAKFLEGTSPREDQRQAYNWAFDYKIICTKLQIVFDYALSCRNMLDECDSILNTDPKPEAQKGEAVA